MKKMIKIIVAIVALLAAIAGVLAFFEIADSTRKCNLAVFRLKSCFLA